MTRLTTDLLSALGLYPPFLLIQKQEVLHFYKLRCKLAAQKKYLKKCKVYSFSY